MRPRGEINEGVRDMSGKKDETLGQVLSTEILQTSNRRYLKLEVEEFKQMNMQHSRSISYLDLTESLNSSTQNSNRTASTVSWVAILHRTT
ncbi:hypothetical protein P152DRAFT_63867 [Eremomyces bilateralis CBS 781.70]|uniref:Uncharacterized protein n=1 Tax=Eremomyces bilateralis CBS 781.70 TaxID=1392243 RepID=A0A6G1FZU0_9PEZI|nr:uncharacterized protein P152DRAFT_63867 [Eremomyces bilateralis CBS 781.70]KAF1811196.1 hypothetical protein P152DRAFT_63867 [Eremomyces bilateralis CBS 781.70]